MTTRPTAPISKRARARARDDIAAIRKKIEAIESRLPPQTRDDPPLFHVGFASSQTTYAQPRQREWGEVPR